MRPRRSHKIKQRQVANFNWEIEESETKHKMTTNMEWTEGDLVWFETNIGHPLPGEVQEVHRAAQVIIVQAVINGKVSYLIQKKKK